MASGYGDNYNFRVYGDQAEGSGADRSGFKNQLGGGGHYTVYGPGPNDWYLNSGSQSTGGRSSGGRSSGGSSGSGNRRTTSRVIPNGPAPELPDLPTLEMPKVDKRKIRALTQEISAPAVRKLREGLQGAMQVKSDNPNVRRMTLREALQGYGTGLESAMQGAGGQARQEHQQELNILAKEAEANWKAKTESIMTGYNNAYKSWLETATKESETTSDEGGSGSGGVVRRNAWGTPEVGPSFQDAWNSRIAGTEYGNYVTSRRGY
jgi:hypothetical protein